MALNDFVTPKIKAVLSIPIICDTFRNRVPVPDTTLYSYMQSGLPEERNLDLCRKASRSKREKSGPALRADRKCHEGGQAILTILWKAGQNGFISRKKQGAFRTPAKSIKCSLDFVMPFFKVILVISA